MLESFPSTRFPKQPELSTTIDFYDCLGVVSNASTEEIDSAWRALDDLQKSDQITHYAWKLLRDPHYRRLYEQTGSTSTLYEGGFFIDAVGEEQVHLLEPNPHDLTTPYGKIVKNMESYQGDEPPIVLVTTGGFSPIHYGHLSMLETAKKALEDSGRTVVGGYFSPSHDDYVSQKYGGEAKLNANHRIHLAQQAVDDSDWLMVDPWESLYVPTDINFTDVMRRLKTYLNEFIKPDTPFDVLYVSGADNAGFVQVLKYMDGGVCVSRDSSSNDIPTVFQQPDIATNPNILFVPSDDPSSEFSSSKVRTWKPLLMPKDASKSYFSWKMNQMNEDSDVRSPKRLFIIRDDGVWAMQQYFPNGAPETAAQALESFKLGVGAAIKRAFEEVELPDLPQALDVHYLPLSEQQALADELAVSRPTLNLDACTNHGTNGINFSRLFELADAQLRASDLISRPGFASIEEQISAIKPGEYLFLDDDIATGSTLNHLMGLLPEDIKVTAIRTLMNESRRIHPEFNLHETSDIVDIRDFILGSYVSGLVVTSPDRTTVARAPYMHPFVSVNSRVQVPLSGVQEFSRRCWELNRELFETLGGNLTLGQATPEFQALFGQLGFETTTKITEIAAHFEALLSVS